MKHIILLVDDDKLILATLKKRFESFDNQVFAVETEEEAKAILEKVVPEIVVLDLLLNSEDGSSNIIDFLKTKPETSEVPVIVLTNMDKPDTREMLLARGIKDYLVKGSMTLDDIYNKVMSYLEPT